MYNVIVWGGTGNYKVVKEILDKKGYSICALFDNNPDLINPYPSIPFIGGQQEFINWIKGFKDPKELKFIVTIGGNYGKDRIAVHNFIRSYGPEPMIIKHNTAYISESAKVDEGSLIYANVSVCVEARIGKACIINTAASVDHECVIDEGVAIGPGARLTGLVQVGKYADIYTGAIILPRIKIGEGAVIGAGAVVVKDVQPYTVVAGNPAKYIREREA